MSKSKKEKDTTELKRSWFQELKGEFRKITWLDKKSLVKQSIVVIIATFLLGCLIAVVDWLIQIGLNYII